MTTIFNKIVLVICMMCGSSPILLGQTNLLLKAPAAVGTWSWGNQLLYEYDPNADDVPILGAYDASRRCGVGLFDTGDSYGTGNLQGNAERLLLEGYRAEKVKAGLPEALLSSLLPGSRSPEPVFLSKIAVYPWLLTADSYYNNIMSSRSRLGIRRDNGASFVPSIHWSPKNYNPFQTEALYSALSRCYNEGKCDGVGLSNLGANELLKASKYFQKKGVPIAANQIQCSLVSNFEDDVEPAVKVANEAGITTLGYSPLGLGLISDSRTERGKLRGFVFGKIAGDESGRELLDTVRRIADEKGATSSQVAINWVKGKGLVPLFGAREESRVLENIKGANGQVELTGKEFDELEVCRRRLKVEGTRNVFQTD